MKTLIIAATGFLLGILATGAAAFWALQSGYIPGFGAPLVQPNWPDVAPAEGDKPEVPEGVKIEEVVLPVPKAVASEGFQASLQGTVETYNALAETGTRLVDTLNEMNQRSTARTFDGFFDLVFEAKTLLAQQVSQTAELSRSLASLERELPAVSDRALAAAGAATVAKGKALVAALGVYSEAVSPVLSGKVPDQSDIDRVFEAASALQAASKDFDAAAEAVVSAVSAAYSAAPILQVERADGAI
jgi:hypothetical protein